MEIRNLGNLEIFESIPETSAHLPPLLFIHGACLGAWCWADNFIDYFGSLGYHALAPNLRGHGKSVSDKPLQKLTIDDYVEDVASITGRLSEPPVVIGHSMGGLVAQRFAARHVAFAIVLMGPSPYSGMQSQALRLIRKHPWSFFLAALRRNIFHIYHDNPGVRDIMFSPNTPEEIVTRCRGRLQEESWMVTQEMSKPQKEPYLVQSPILVLGGEHDGTVLPKTTCDTAKAYKAPCHIFQGMGHNLMLEPGWEEVARYIEGWLHRLEK